MPDPNDHIVGRAPKASTRKNLDDRAVQELADHLEDLYQEALSRGATEDEARNYVERRLGETADAAAEVLSAVRERLGSRLDRWAEKREEGLRHKSLALGSVADRMRDLRMATRSLFRCPLFTGVTVLVLALGIGATTAIFTLVDAILLTPLPFDEANRLFAVGHAAPSRGLQNAGQCAAWHLNYEEEAEVFRDLGMWRTGSVGVTGNGEPEMVPIMVATSGLFRALRLDPIIGRGLTPGDEDPDAPNVLMLSYGFWRSRYGGSADALQQTLEVNGEPWTIVGVMPPTLRGLDSDPKIIAALKIDREGLFVGNIGFNAVARLEDGVTVEQAKTDMTRVLPMAWEKFPGGPVASSKAPTEYTPTLVPLRDNIVGSASAILWILLGGVGVVLLISFANVANLFLVRAETKDTEMAVRAAIGANRGRVAWEYLKETLLLGTLGGVAGLALALICIRVLVAVNVANLPRLAETSINPRVVLFSLGVSLVGGIVVGLVPLMRRGDAGFVESLKQAGQSSMRSRDRRRLQSGLAISQMALTLVLLVAAGLMLRSYLALHKVDPGFGDPQDLLTFRVSIPPSLIEDIEARALAHEAIARRLGEIPGVVTVGMASSIPLGGGGNVNPFWVDGLPSPDAGPPPIRRHKWIGEGYFETLRIPMLAGRSFTWDEIHERIPGALVSESLAREYWGSPEAALGHRVAIQPNPVRWHEIIGVVADVREDGLSLDPVPMVYWPQVNLAFWEGTTEEDVQTWRTMGFAIRGARTDHPDFLRAVQEAVWEVNPNLPLRSIGTMNDLISQSVSQTSSTLTLLLVAGGVALILGIVGVYGVIAYAVARRSREIGMRLALGAEKATVTKMVLRQGFVLASTGVALGVALALGLTHLMSALLYDVAPIDPITYVVVAAGLLAVALLASFIPARRAAEVEPMEALRVE
jgi:predicted permease